MRLNNEVAVITGASSGIGRAVALLFAQHGAKVACLDLQPNSRLCEEKPDTVERVIDAGGEAIFIRTDVSKVNDVKTAIQKVVSDYKKISILVNCAGIFIRNTITDVSDEEWDQVLGTNLTGYFYTCREVIPYMMELGQGSIVNISSIHGIRGTSNAITYCVSKGGIENLTRQLAVEFAPHNIRVNAISPGTIKTAMCKPFLETPEVVAEYKKRTLLPRLGVPEDVANCALFLASKEASFIVGHSLVVDGGWTIT